MQQFKRILVPVLLVFSACGSAEDPQFQPGSPVNLPYMDAPPSCLVALDPNRVNRGTPLREAAYQQLWMVGTHHLFEEQYARLLAAPILANPTAQEWNQQGDGWHVEGRTVVRGVDWGIISMGATYIFSEEEKHFRGADIHHSVERTQFEFEDSMLVFAENYGRLDGHIRGCQPSTGTNFEVGPWVVDGQVEERVLLCWGGPYVAPPYVPGGSVISAPDPSVACLQAFHDVVPSALYHGAALPPVVILY
jgi:hypothetical protein